MASSDVLINIGAKDGASSVLESVMSKVGGLATSFATFGPAIAGVGAAVAGAVAGFVAVGTAINAVTDAADKIDALSDKARGLGESVGSLQEFQFALNEAGNVDAEKSIQVLEKLSATVGKIATGQDKEGMEVFKQLGLDAEQLSLEGPIAQFEAIQNKLSEIGNNSERAAVAQKIFGKAALELLPALSTQASSMKESMEYARGVGAAVSDEGASSVAAMNDAIGRVGLTLQGLANSVAVEMAPAVQAVATYISTWGPPIVELANELLPMVVDATAYIADSALDAARAFGLMSGNVTWADAIAKARQDAAVAAQEMEAMRQANRAIASEAPEPDATKFEAVLATLERQLQVAIHGEEAVKAQEQLAEARNEQERERIGLLQEQVAEQLKFNEARKQRLEDEKKAEKEREAMQSKLANVPKNVGAFESRVMLRGPSQDPALMEAKKQVEEQKKTNAKLDRLYEEAKRKNQYLEVQVIQ